MIAEARKIRQNQTLRSNALSCIVTSTEPKDSNFKVINLQQCYFHRILIIVINLG